MAKLARGLLGLTIGGLVCSGGACIEAGIPNECTQVEECASDAPAGQIATACTQGVCKFASAIPSECAQVNDCKGKAPAGQIATDCTQGVCMFAECAQLEDCVGKASTCQIATDCTQGVCVFENKLEGN